MRGLIWVLLCAGFASAQVFTVSPDGTADYTDIQSAINAAVSGDTVLVEDGIYEGSGNRDISFFGKAITVCSRNGPEQCIVSAPPAQLALYRGFIFNSAETRDSVLEGFTITQFCYRTCNSEGGAAIFIGNGSPTIRRCVVRYCTAQLNDCPGRIYGGAICVSRGNPLFERCLIRQNGGVYYGGGIACGNSLDPGGVSVFLKNCIIVENSASAGGGISLYDYRGATITNCTIANNSGYGLYCQNPLPGPVPGPSQFNENIVWQNTPAEIFGYNPLLNRNYVPRFPTPPGAKFVNASTGDYHLQWDSPCIDYCRYAEYSPGDVDFDGEPRLMGTYVDAGADEVGPKQADFSRNGRIALEDLAFLSAAWQSTPVNPNWYLLSDLQPDNIIDINDLAVFAADWLWQADWYQQ